jgi:nucleotide-binding universal stress UspA family protein
MTRSVVVGVDGSESSLAAVDLAATEARLRGLPLRVVHAFMWPELGAPLGPSPYGPPEGGLQNDAERLLATAVERAGQAAPDLDVDSELVTGGAAAVLVEESRAAAMVVLGDRGLGGFTGLLVGSVAVQLAAHAHCPVAVVRGRPEPSGPVVLGVDGSPGAGPAVLQAFEEASLRGAELVALHAWVDPVPPQLGDVLPVVYDVDQVEAEEMRLLAEALAGCRERYPDVVVNEELVRASARDHLIERSAQAQLLVVGTRGLGGVRGLLLGSVSQAALHHADCPVLVVPSPASPS